MFYFAAIQVCLSLELHRFTNHYILRTINKVSARLHHDAFVCHAYDPGNLFINDSGLFHIISHNIDGLLYLSQIRSKHAGQASIPQL